MTEAPESLPVRVGLSEGLLLTTIDGRWAVFAEESQQVFEPNTASCAILALLEEPLSLPVLCDRMAAIFTGDRAAIECLLVDWSASGLIDVFLPDNADSNIPVASACLPALDSTIDLFAYGEDTGWFESYRHLPRASGSGCSIEAWQWEGLGIVKVTDRPARIVPRHMLTARFRFSLVQAILDRTMCIAVHCACLMQGDRTIMLLGAPGAGKSTLAMFASQHGLELRGDDIALFDPKSGCIVALSLPLTLKQDSWPMIALTDWKCERQEFVSREDGVEVVYLPLWRTSREGPVAPTALILLDRTEAAEPELSPWPTIDCLRHLCSESRSQAGNASVSDMRALLAMLDSAETFRLRYSDAATAGKLLGRQFGK